MAPEEIKAGIDKRMDEIQVALEKRSEVEVQRIGKEVFELKGQLTKFENELARAGKALAEPTDEFRTIGEQVVDLGEYKRYAEQKTANRSDRMEVKGFASQMIMERRALTMANQSGAVGVLATRRLRGVYAPPSPKPRLFDILNVIPLGPNEAKVDFVRETGFAPIRLQLAAATAADAATLTVDNANGVKIGAKLYKSNGTALPGVVSSVNTTSGVITMTENVGEVIADNSNIDSLFYAGTAEGLVKPEAYINTEAVSTTLVTLANHITISRQMSRNVEQFRRYVDTRLMERWLFNLERHVLYGNDSSTELPGISGASRVQTYAWSDGEAGDTRIDAVRRAITLSLIAQYRPTGVVTHPTDWELTETTKDGESRYVFGLIAANGASPMLWRLPVIDTVACDVGDFFVGAWDLGSEVYVKDQASITASDSHSDNFTRNLVTVLCEGEATHAILRPESFVKGTFDSAPA